MSDRKKFPKNRDKLYNLSNIAIMISVYDEAWLLIITALWSNTNLVGATIGDLSFYLLSL